MQLLGIYEAEIDDTYEFVDEQKESYHSER